jgi:hypothetical protein
MLSLISFLEHRLPKQIAIGYGVFGLYPPRWWFGYSVINPIQSPNKQSLHLIEGGRSRESR